MSGQIRKYQQLGVSQHAERRMRQRGIPWEVAELLLQNGDVSLHAGNACETVRLSADACAGLLAEGVAPALVERARRVAAVCNRLVVSLLRPKHGAMGARYRRQWPTRKRSGRVLRHSAQR